MLEGGSLSSSSTNSPKLRLAPPPTPIYPSTPFLLTQQLPGFFAGKMMHVQKQLIAHFSSFPIVTTSPVHLHPLLICSFSAFQSTRVWGCAGSLNSIMCLSVSIPYSSNTKLGFSPVCWQTERFQEGGWAFKHTVYWMSIEFRGRVHPNILSSFIHRHVILNLYDLIFFFVYLRTQNDFFCPKCLCISLSIQWKSLRSIFFLVYEAATFGQTFCDYSSMTKKI